MVLRLLRSCSPHTVWWALDPLQTLASINHNNYCLQQSLTDLLEALILLKRLNGWVGFWKDWCCVMIVEKSLDWWATSHLSAHFWGWNHLSLFTSDEDGLRLWKNCKLPTKHESRYLKAASGSTFMFFHGTTSKWLWNAYHCPASWG